MKLLVVVDGHLYRTPDGQVWSEGIYNYRFFQRYLRVFEHVCIAMRIEAIETNENYPNLCSGEGLEFCAVTNFRGPGEYATKYRQVRKDIKRIIRDCDTAIFRLPSTIGFQFLREFRKTERPWSIEVVADPWEYAAPGMFDSPLRPYIRHKWTSDLRKACMQANGVLYVTTEYLQKKYPCRAMTEGETDLHFTCACSDVQIPELYYSVVHEYRPHKPLRIVHVANAIANHAKGHEELIYALREIKRKGHSAQVTFIGDGPLIPCFQRIAKEQEVSEEISFVGRVQKQEDLCDMLNESDLFVFPSHTEGLPRVLIEAMAIGLPCIATNVGGIPELLEGENLIPAGDVEAVAKSVLRIFDGKTEDETKDLLCKMGRGNRERALLYRKEKLDGQRTAFLEKVRSITEGSYENK